MPLPTAPGLIERLRALRGRERRPSDRAAFVYWLMALMGVGAVVLVGFAATVGAWALGVALAARLVFALILLAAVLPWLGPGRMNAN